MKNLFTTVLILASSYGFSQYYYLPSSANGNPGGLNALDDEFPQGTGLSASWTNLMSTQASNAWSSTQTIPFAFNFNGSPVTSYKMSSTGVLTFTTAATTVPGAAPATLPDASIPDNSVCVWGWNMSGGNDNIVTQTFGTAGSQQHWVFMTSMTNPTTTGCWHYWAIVLEEGSDDIFLVDMRNNCTAALTLGVQIDATEGYQVTGSPNVDGQAATDGSAADNVYYQFIYGTQAAYDMAGISMTGNQYNLIADAPFDITGTLVNQGSATINTLDINYSVNGGATVTAPVSGLNIALLDQYSFTHPTAWTPTATGAYTIEVWASNINGNPDQNTANDMASGTMEVFNNFTQRTPLYETFTSSTCGPCVPANITLEGLFNTPANSGKFTSLKYQMSWPGDGDPYFTDEGQVIRSNYAINSVPRLEVDGGWDQNAGNVTQQLMDQWYSKPAFVDLTATYSVSGPLVSVDVAIDPLETLSANDLVLHMAVFEYETFQNVGSNGETEFAHVMKKMLPDASGTSIPQLMSGVQQSYNETYTFQGSYVLPPDANSPVNHASEHTVEEFTDLGVAVWIQDESSLEVYQSVTATMVVGIDESNGLFLGAKMYPNPTIGNTKLAFQLAENTSDLEISIIDNTGKLVVSKNYGSFPQGRSTIDLGTSSLDAGLYMVQLTANGRNHTMSLNVLN